MEKYLYGNQWNQEMHVIIEYEFRLPLIHMYYSTII